MNGQYSTVLPGVGRVFIDGPDKPDYVIQVNGRRYVFEWHFYCGPVALTKRGDPAAEQPTEFLEAASFWAQQGKRVENGLCVWDRVFEPEPITKHLGGRHHEVIGWTPERRVKGE